MSQLGSLAILGDIQNIKIKSTRTSDLVTAANLRTDHSRWQYNLSVLFIKARYSLIRVVYSIMTTGNEWLTEHKRYKRLTEHIFVIQIVLYIIFYQYNAEIIMELVKRYC